MVKTTDLTSDSVDATAGFYDYRVVESELTGTVSQAPATASAAGNSSDCAHSDCPEHPDSSSPTPANASARPGLGLPQTR